MSFKPYTEKIKKKKLEFVRIRIKMIRIRNTEKNSWTSKEKMVGLGCTPWLKAGRKK